MTIVVDTSAILALYDADQDGHDEVAAVVAATPALLAVSPLVTAEADYMLSGRIGAAGAQRFVRDVVGGAFELAEWRPSDHAAALAVTEQFGGRDYVGMTDAGNVVLADRYRTTRLLTLDQRHFRVLKPLWGADHFTLLPFDAEDPS